jgi:hypothetical protein
VSSDHGVAELPENVMMNGGMRTGRLFRKQIDSALIAPFQRFAPLSIGGDNTTLPPGFIRDDSYRPLFFLIVLLYVQ